MSTTEHLSARLAEARWACLGAQARLDRLEALQKGNTTEAAACTVWLALCDMRREHWAKEAVQ